VDRTSALFGDGLIAARLRWADLVPPIGGPPFCKSQVHRSEAPTPSGACGVVLHAATRS
jgi:hypothetical protein